MKARTACTMAVVMAMAAAIALLVMNSGDRNATADGELKGVPAEFQPWILKAARECEHPELTPALLAAQLKQESNFRTDRNTISSAGAQGPAQFIPDTWATWGRDTDGNRVSDPFDVGDAVMAQGRMMCSLIGQAKTSGISADVRALALAGYNAGWGAVQGAGGIPPIAETENYVRTILPTMKQFQGPTELQVSGTGTGPDAVRKAAARLATPYSWGGGGPPGPSPGFCDDTNGYDKTGECVADTTVGFDCSSLVQYAFWPEVKLPRTAAEQYGATSDRPVARDDLQPGDLLFWSHRDGSIYHVAIYAGDAKVLQSPSTGRRVELAPISSAMPAAEYHGATRP